jgi:hypothetical protein
MRALRLFSTGAVMLLLAVSAVGVAAQPEEEEAESVTHVTGTVTPRQADPGIREFDECGCHWRGTTWEGPLTMSDPRLTGHQWSDWNIDEFAPHPNGAVYVGNMGVVNDEGSWEGTFSGVEYPGTGDDHLQGLLFGEGAYRGLSAMLYYTETDGRWEVEGLVFPGKPPPLP